MIFPMLVDFSEVSVAYATIVAKKGDIQHLLKSRRHHSKIKRFPIAFWRSGAHVRLELANKAPCPGFSV